MGYRKSSIPPMTHVYVSGQRYHCDLQKNEPILILISFKRYFSFTKLKSPLTLKRHCNSVPRAQNYNDYLHLRTT